MAKLQGWIGVDFDGTLVRENFASFPEPGAPIEKMVQRVRVWLAAGREVRILTARVGECTLAEIAEVSPEWAKTGITVKDWIDYQRELIKLFCRQQFGEELPVTASKDLHMLELWDDRCVQVVPNTGIPAHEYGFSRV